MRLLFTLDYELFLGSNTGSVERCLVAPMTHLERALKPAGGKFTIFVDATYLLRAKQLSIGQPQLARDYEQICDHLRQLADRGHDLQLHIHPHWAFSTYNDGQWVLDHQHYKLCDLDAKMACDIACQAKALLDETIGKQTTVFRAGGFSAQPTQLLRNVMEQCGLRADSSVCPGTSYDSPQQQYDYTTAPTAGIYRFSDDICVEQRDGEFAEVPISMHSVSPLFHWRLVVNRLLKRPEHRTFGDGVSVKTTGESIMARLTSRQNCLVTIDGYKITFLRQARDAALAAGHSLLTVIGHPKLATPFSVRRLADFAAQAAGRGDEFTTITQLIDEPAD